MTLLAAFAALAGLASGALAEAPTTRTETKEKTATIVAIDSAARAITLNSKGGTVKMGVRPEVKRFNELKVGDQITFSYLEAVLTRISKPGQAGPVSSERTIVRGTGPRPSATVTQQQKATVTIQTIAADVPAVTIVSEDGDTLSLKVRDGRLLEGFKVGDKVDIVYTEALIISVK